MTSLSLECLKCPTTNASQSCACQKSDRMHPIYSHGSLSPPHRQPDHAELSATGLQRKQPSRSTTRHLLLSASTTHCRPIRVPLLSRRSEFTGLQTTNSPSSMHWMCVRTRHIGKIKRSLSSRLERKTTVCLLVPCLPPLQYSNNPSTLIGVRGSQFELEYRPSFFEAA